MGPSKGGKVRVLIDTNLLIMALFYFQYFLHIIQYVTPTIRALLIASLPLALALSNKP